MSTAQTDASAVLGSEIHACEWSRHVEPHAGVVHDAEDVVEHPLPHLRGDTVGIAQGTSITARMRPRPLKLELTTRAIDQPERELERRP